MLDAHGELAAEGAELLAAARHWQEQNPMLGLRGVRLGIVKGGLYRMQVRALVEAACRCAGQGKHPVVEVMIPLVINLAELDLVRHWVESEIADGAGRERRRPGHPRRDHDRDPARRARGPTRSPRRPTSSRSAPTTSPR